jgi:hypothetical protein
MNRDTSSIGTSEFFVRAVPAHFTFRQALVATVTTVIFPFAYPPERDAAAIIAPEFPYGTRITTISRHTANTNTDNHSHTQDSAQHIALCTTNN